VHCCPHAPVIFQFWYLTVLVLTGSGIPIEVLQFDRAHEAERMCGEGVSRVPGSMWATCGLRGGVLSSHRGAFLSSRETVERTTVYSGDWDISFHKSGRAVPLWSRYMQSEISLASSNPSICQYPSVFIPIVLTDCVRRQGGQRAPARWRDDRW